jgi:phosphoribosylanthranilate isomerase
MPLTVKICGLSEPSTLETALDAGADMVGFVFFTKSPRHVSYERARELRALVKGRAKTVALTVDADDDTLRAIVESLDPDMLQLHGHETPQRVAEVRATFTRPVRKAVPIGSLEDLAKIAAYEDVADWLLFDAPPPADAQRPGGNAVAFDWSLLKGYSGRRPWLLAGGLVPETVAAAGAATSARGFDVSSGVESAPGRKDATAIRRFIAAARSA